MNRRVGAAVIGGGLVILSAIVARQPASVVPPPASNPVVSTPAGTVSPCHAHDGLPDATCTPGATDPRVTQDTIGQTICKPGYTATVRPPVSVTNALKAQQMKEYGLSGNPSDYEEDHLIALTDGGAPNDPKNLWPMPWQGAWNARDKDRLEVHLNSLVCSKQLTLIDAQQMLSHDWVAAYVHFFGDAPATETQNN